MKSLLIIGAGSAGEHVLKEILKNEKLKKKYNVIGFLDSDEKNMEKL